MNYIVTTNKEHFKNLGTYHFCDLDEMILPEVIAVDTETTGLSTLHCDFFAVQIGTGKNNYLIDLTSASDLIFEDVIPYLKGKKMVFHNSAFDLGFFYKHNFFPQNVFDTFLASKIIYNGCSYPFNRHRFGDCMERELGLEYDKSEQKNIHLVQLKTRKAIQYCFNDVDKLLDLQIALVKKLREKEMVPTYKLHCRYIRALAYMEQCGMPISEDRWDEKIIQDETDLETASRVVTDYIYDNLEHYRDTQIDLFSTDKKIMPLLTSQKQMLPVFKDLEIPVINDEGKESLNKDILKRSDHEFVKLWLDYQEAAHDVTTYGANIKDKVVDGRIYTSYNPLLDTARISTRRGGINFLNFPANEKTRRCIKAKEGYKLIVCDYDGQENVVGADFHNDETMVRSINEGLDLHCAFARMIYPEELGHLSDDEIKKNHKKKRDFAKPTRFAKAYGGNGYTISKNQNLSIEEGQRLDSLFNELHADIFEWGDEMYERAIEVGYIESVDGFKLHLPRYQEFLQLKAEFDSYGEEFWGQYRVGKNEYRKLKNSEKKIKEDPEGEHELYNIQFHREYELYREHRPKISEFFSNKSKYYRLCLNNPVQTTSAHQTKRAVAKFFEIIEENGDLWKVKICNVPHDEIILEVEENLADKYRKILQETMIEEGNYYLNSGLVKMSCEANIGDDWNEAK